MLLKVKDIVLLGPWYKNTVTETQEIMVGFTHYTCNVWMSKTEYDKLNNDLKGGVMSDRMFEIGNF